MNKINEKKELETIVSKDAYSSYNYALNVIKGRFEKGEEAISKKADYSYKYALNVIKGRFEQGEEAISKKADYSKLYKKNIFKAFRSKKPKVKANKKLTPEEAYEKLLVLDK